MSHADIMIDGADVLTPDGWRQAAAMFIRDGRIEDISASAPIHGGRRIDAQGLWALPGIIDLHGDAFERHISPRPNVQFSAGLAIEANDVSLINAGITTFYYSITDGFEPGLRGRDTARTLLAEIEQKAERLLCDSRIHIRHEQAATGGHEELLGWLRDRRVHLLSLNNHLPAPGDTTGLQRYLNGATRRLAKGPDEIQEFAVGLIDRLPEGAAQIAELVAMAQAQGIPLASHDDKSGDDVARAHGFGVSIAEFPMTSETARAFRSLGVHVLMGAPNAVRGASHVSGLSVRDATAERTVDILCSDYHYPSLLRAPFLMNELDLMDFADAWAMVSENPARAAGLQTNKGTLTEGKSADIVLIAPKGGALLDVVATIARGRIVMCRI